MIKEYMQVIIDWLACLDWLALLSTTATVALAILAWLGLKSWKHQTNTQIKIHFIDALIDAVNEYVIAMSLPIQVVGFVEIGIQSYTESLRVVTGENDGFIRFIERRGEEDGKRIFESLNEIRPLVAKIRSLMTKGQVLGFENYDQAYRACEMLIWSYSKIDAFAGLISSASLNWENPTVQRNLSGYRDINSSDFEKNLKDHSLIILEFSNNTYQKLLS